MKIYPSPYIETDKSMQIMIMDDPSGDGKEVYYRIAGWPFVFAFGLPSKYSMFEVIHYARCNADYYSEVLFK